MAERKRERDMQEQARIREREEEKRQRKAEKDALKEAERSHKRRKKAKRRFETYYEAFTNFKQLNLSGRRKESLDWRDIPWPVDSLPSDLKDLEALLTPGAIRSFLRHSKIPTKQLLKDHLLFWHPDKFTKYEPYISSFSHIKDLVLLVSRIFIELNNNESL